MNQLKKNEVAVITGGNSGIGFGIAEAFYTEGAAGAIIGRNQETLNQAALQLDNNVTAVNADVTNLSELENAFKQITEKFGKIDVVVANAGAGITGTVADLSEADYNKPTALNKKKTFTSRCRKRCHI